MGLTLAHGPGEPDVGQAPCSRSSHHRLECSPPAERRGVLIEPGRGPKDGFLLLKKELEWMKGSGPALVIEHEMGL